MLSATESIDIFLLTSCFMKYISLYILDSFFLKTSISNKPKLMEIHIESLYKSFLFPLRY